MRFCTAVVALGLVASASTAFADVKLVAQMTGTMMGRTASGETVTQIKGNKMRTDQAMGGAQLSTIMDLDTGELITINHKSKEAEIWSIADFAKTMTDIGVSASGVNVKMTPTGESKDIAGHKAQGYDLSVSVKSAMANQPGMQMTVSISGPAFLSPTAPGVKDYANFYVSAAEKGFFIGDPRAAKMQPGNAKGMMEFYRAMAEKGIPLESRNTIKLSGDGPMAAVFAKMGGGEMSTTVTSVSDAPIADSTFAVPEGYKVKRQKAGQ